MVNKEKIGLIVTLIAVGAIIFGYLAKDLAVTGKLVAQTDFQKFMPYFSILKPQARIVMAENNYLIAEPAYFDLYLPRDFVTATVELIYKNEFNYPLALGPSVADGWDMQKIAPVENQSSAFFSQATLSFSLADKNINQGKLRFIISAPGLNEEDKGVYVKSVKITLERPAIWQENLVNNLFKYAKYVKDQY